MHVPVSVCVSMDTRIRACVFVNIPVYMNRFLFIKQQTFSRPSVHVRCVLTRCLTVSRIESRAEAWVLPPRCGVESVPARALMLPTAWGTENALT